MLNYPSAERFFDNCLQEAGAGASGFGPQISLSEVRLNPEKCKAVVKALRDIQTGADAVLARGKPAEDTLGLTFAEWERRWMAWAASRKAAFFSRAALLLLGQAEYFDYFVATLKASHNIVFLGGANDALQHATGCYLSGPEEDLDNADLARWWEEQQSKGLISF